MKVNWDDEIANIWKNIQNVPNHQPDLFSSQRIRQHKAINGQPLMRGLLVKRPQ
jgi:hypothetical protein